MKLFAKFRKTEEKSTDKAFMQMVMPSVLGIVLCMICLCSATWAWFGTSMNNESVIQAGSYEATIKVAKADNRVLKAGVLYEVTIAANSSIRGYLAVNIEDVGLLYSEQPYNNGSGKKAMSFSVYLSPAFGGDKKIEVHAFWGELPGGIDPERMLVNGETYIVVDTNGTVSNDPSQIVLLENES